MNGYKNWIGGWGICQLWKYNTLILLISTQKLYFGDDGAIYDIILQEPLWNDVTHVTKDMQPAVIQCWSTTL